MNLKQWNRNHTMGLLVGVFLPMVLIPLIILIMAWAQNFYFQQLWFKFWNSNGVMSKILTLSILANLGVFYLYLNKEKYHFAAGIIVGSLLYLPLVVYFLFF